MRGAQSLILRELQLFVDADHTTLHCEDGEWDLRIVRREDSEFMNDLPQRSVMIAENGCGDCLFLKSTSGGKVGSKVFVFWHEEGRHEVFAQHLRELTTRTAPAPLTQPKSVSRPQISLKQLESTMASSDALQRQEALEKWYDTNYGAEALPLLRRALEDDYVGVVIKAALCIAKLGPEALSRQESTQKEYGDLEFQLMTAGGKVWRYSGYANPTSAIRGEVKA